MEKIFPCLFLLDVKVCSFRKSETFDVMDECFKCSHYKRFVEEMEREEEEFFEEVDRLRKRVKYCCICACMLDSDNRSDDIDNVCRRCRHTLEM